MIHQKCYCRFLGKELSDEEVDKIVEHTTFSSMKKSSTTNLKSNELMDQNVSEFIRKGQIGDYVNLLDQEQIEYIDELTKTRFKHTGFY